MKNSLHRKKVAILVADGFEQSELEQPRAALQEAGAETQIVSPEKDQVKGWDHDKFGEAFKVDVRGSHSLRDEFASHNDG